MGFFYVECRRVQIMPSIDLPTCRCIAGAAAAAVDLQWGPRWWPGLAWKGCATRLCGWCFTSSSLLREEAVMHWGGGWNMDSVQLHPFASKQVSMVVYCDGGFGQ